MTGTFDPEDSAGTAASEPPEATPAASRRSVLRGAGIVAAGAAVSAVSAPWVSNPAKAQTTTWRIQTSWPSGVGLNTFKAWCTSIAEKTGGELAWQPYAAKEVVGDFELFDAVKNGALDAMNSFTLYWAGKTPAAVFLSSYPLGLRNPHEWDTFYYGLGGLEIAREVFARQGMHYVGVIQHGPNIIHSKKPIRSIEDFRGLKLRVPGGMVAEVFQAAGAQTTLMPGGEVFSALEKGTIDAADYTGPAVNYDLGLHQVTKFVSLGPPGVMSLYQPVDVMDLVVNTQVWNRLSPKMKQFVEMEVHVYSDLHHAAIQKADQEAWKKFEAAGTSVNRLAEEDVEEFTRLAVPRWFAWANKDKDAARLFKIQLDYMMSGSLGYVTPDHVKGEKLAL
jgi:TRAP-type mannitol/chloroaromatic compound transport system substrate-binding protein